MGVCIRDSIEKKNKAGNSFILVMLATCFSKFAVEGKRSLEELQERQPHHHRMALKSTQQEGGDERTAIFPFT